MITLTTLTHDQWMIWTPIGSWYFNTDSLSEERMRSKYAELLAKYPNMQVKKELLRKGEQIW